MHTPLRTDTFLLEMYFHRCVFFFFFHNKKLSPNCLESVKPNPSAGASRWARAMLLQLDFLVIKQCDRRTASEVNQKYQVSPGEGFVPSSYVSWVAQNYIGFFFSFFFPPAYCKWGKSPGRLFSWKGRRDCAGMRKWHPAQCAFTRSPFTELIMRWHSKEQGEIYRPCKDHWHSICIFIRHGEQGEEQNGYTPAGGTEGIDCWW